MNLVACKALFSVNTKRIILLAASAGMALAVIAGLNRVSIAAPPANFQNEILITNISEPTNIVFTPDGRMLVAERGGRIHVVQAGATQVDPTPFGQITNINTQDGERGLLGLTLDPNFASNGYYYVFYTVNTPSTRDRVSRFTASGNTTVPGSEMLVWEDNMTAPQYHHGGNVAFGADGKLYFSTGDGFGSGAESQQLTSNRGKIFRINSDGTTPADNPFNDGAGSNLDAIWARGLRNPYRFSFDPANGRMYIGDVGSNDNNSSIEELNIGAAGANYGWPTCEGVCGTAGMTNPWFSYPHGGRDAAVTAGFVYRGNQFPSQYVGSFFYGDYARNWIKRITMDASGNATGSVNFEPTDGSDDGSYGDIVDIKQGPDGALYYADIGVGWPSGTHPASIRRIRYTAVNQPPVVVASADPLHGSEPLSVNFSSVGSSDPEGQPLSFSWSFGDGSSSTEANPTHVYQQVGMYTARLTISDGVNNTLSNPIAVAVGNAPVVAITSPANNLGFKAGDVISFGGTATDAEDGDLPPSAYTWDIVFHHETHIHPAFGPQSGMTGGTFEIPTSGHDYSGNTSYEIILTATDSNGLKTNTSVYIYPQKVNLSFNTVPAGLQVALDGITRTTPFVVDALQNFQYTINAPSQLQGGSQYDFASWSDGGAQSHAVTVPSVDQSFTANFNTTVQTQLQTAYAFDEGTGTTTQDKSGNNNTATLTGATWTAAGRFANAVSYNGTSSRVTAGNVALGSQFTIEAWVNNPTNSTYETVATVGGNRDLYLGNGQLVFYNGSADIAFGGAISNNVWHHVAVSYDGTAMRAYVDGVQVGTTQTMSLAAYTGALQLGAWTFNGSNTDYFSGTIDEARVYNRALSQAEIQGDMSTPIGPPAPDTAPPVLSNGQPTGPQPSGTTVTTLSVTTNESATCRYDTVADMAYSAMTGVFATTGGTNHSTTISGLQDGQSYVYFVRCQDAVFNSNSVDYSITFSVDMPPPPDTTPPSVAMSAPANGAVVAGAATVSANASDDVAVTGVQFLLDGNNLGAEDVTSPYSMSWNTLTTANGVHTLSARARDAAGNQTTSLVVSITVNNTSLANLVAAYGFDEGTGASVADATGNGNNGTIAGAVWTAGRFGNGLRFNGTNNLVNVSDANSLDLTNGMTLEAWVNPAALGSSWRSIIAKERSTNGVAYQLAASSSGGNLPATREYIGGNRTLNGGSRLAANSWAHLAATYDGTTQRLYVNGVQVSSRAQTGNIIVTTNQLRIGGDATLSEYFNGTIDEVRIYNRALSVGEVQLDMNRPVSASVPDTFPPVLSNGQPSGVLPAGTTGTSLSLNTNENATCRYVDVANTEFANMPFTFTSTGGTTHTTQLTGLTDGSSYTYYVRCQDISSNPSTADYLIGFSVAVPDPTPPAVALTAPPDGATISGTVTVTADASDNVAVTGVQFLLDGNNLGSEDTSSPYSAAWTTNSSTNGVHTLSARARDAAGNQTTSTTVTVTLNNTAPTGLLRAFPFNEGTGTAIADVSGNSGNATATNATWTTSGRYGRGLTFNGSSSRVTTSAAVVLPASFTIEAWVLNPTNSAYETIATVGSSRDLYLRNGVINFYTGSTDLAFGAAISTNVWHHVAVTYSGTTLQAYLDGVAYGTPRTVTLASVTANLQVGAWITGSSNSDFLGGTIDEVRVYNRALSAAELQTDMNTPIVPGNP